MIGRTSFIKEKSQYAAFLVCTAKNDFVIMIDVVKWVAKDFLFRRVYT